MSLPESPPQTSENGRLRVVVENVRPQVDGGRFPIKRVVGDVVLVEADVFTDGHDSLVAELQYRSGKEPEWRRAPMTADKNDRWQSEFTVDDVGEYEFRIIGFIDHFGTWRRDFAKRVAAKQDVAVELLVGADLVHQASESAKGSDRERLDQWERRLRTDNSRQFINE